jgi:O-antigen/teichoic acid export membrane protein
MHDGDVFGYACIILGITFPVLFSISYMSVYFQTRGNFFYSIVVLLAEKFFIAIAIVISALFFAQTLWLVLLHFIFYCAINAVAYFWFTKHVKTLGKARDTGIEKFSFTNTASLIIPKVLGNLDKLILGYFLGAPILAIYAIGLLIFDTFDGLLNLMQNVITKKMAKMPSINILKKYFSFVPFSFFVGMSLIGMLACYIGIPILYGEAYAESVYVGQLLCITLPFLMLWKLTTNWMGVNNKHKDYMLFTNCYYICNVIFVFISLYLYTSVLALVIAKIVLGVCFFGFSIYYLSSGEKSKSKYSVV